MEWNIFIKTNPHKKNMVYKKRMRIIKTHKIIFSLFGFLFLFSYRASCASDERKAELAPNIIFIVADDMGPWTLIVNNDPNTYSQNWIDWLNQEQNSETSSAFNTGIDMECG